MKLKHDKHLLPDYFYGNTSTITVMVLFINTVDVMFSLNLFEKLKADGKSQKPY